MWDVWNSASVLAARSLVDAGWVVDAVLPRGVPWSNDAAFNGECFIEEALGETGLERVLFGHPLDAVFFHGDDQMRWLLRRRARLPSNLRRHLAPPSSIETALSKRLSMDVAREVGVPVLPTTACSSEEELRAALASFECSAQVVVKGEGGSAGRAVRSVRPEPHLASTLWAELSGDEGTHVLVQRRLEGPRLLATFVFERGVRRACVQHLKQVAFPHRFGVTARGVTVRIEDVATYVDRLFGRLAWHGLGNVEFRQDLRDGRWYFMEINPRVPSSIGIQRAAGVDVAAIWADVCRGEGERHAGNGDYRLGVSWSWSVPLFAAALRRPYLLPLAVHDALRGSDLSSLSLRSAAGALKIAAWRALHG